MLTCIHRSSNNTIIALACMSQCCSHQTVVTLLASLFNSKWCPQQLLVDPFVTASLCCLCGKSLSLALREFTQWGWLIAAVTAMGNAPQTKPLTTCARLLVRGFVCGLFLIAVTTAIRGLLMGVGCQLDTASRKSQSKQSVYTQLGIRTFLCRHSP